MISEAWKAYKRKADAEDNIWFGIPVSSVFELTSFDGRFWAISDAGFAKDKGFVSVKLTRVGESTGPQFIPGHARKPSSADNPLVDPVPEDDSGDDQ